MSPVPNLAHLALLAAALLPAAPALARSIYNEKVEGFLKRQILETPTTTRLGTLTNTATATRPLPAGPTVTVATDACRQIAGLNMTTPALARACLQSFEFDETIRQNVLTNIDRVYNRFYTFDVYAENAQAPWTESKLDIAAEIQRLNTTTYDTDYAFQMDVINTFNSGLNDGHTVYSFPCYESTFQSVLPFPIVPIAPKPDSPLSDVQIRILPEASILLTGLGSNFVKRYNYDFEQYDGALVNAIDGQSANEYVDFIARTVVGTYLDHGVRTNSVFSSYRLLPESQWDQKLGDFAAPVGVAKDGVNMTITRINATTSETIYVPYQAFFLGRRPFTSAASFWNNYCAVSNTTNGINYETQSTPSRGAESDDQEATAVTPTDNTDEESASSLLGSSFTVKFDENVRGRGPEYLKAETKFDASTVKKSGAMAGTSPLGAELYGRDTVGTGLKFFTLTSNPRVAVLVIGTFSPDLTFKQTLTVLIGGLQKIRKSTDYLIIDVSNNGGGYLCLGTVLHRFLAGSSVQANPGFETALRGSDFAQDIVKANIRLGLNSTFYSPVSWNYVNGQALSRTEDVFDEEVTVQVNGLPDIQSERFTDYCGDTSSFPSSPLYDLSKIAIVGNGNCASTCALFTTVMKEQHNVKVYVYGGNPTTSQMEYKGMAGAQVLEWADLDSEIITAGLTNDPRRPPQLIIGANTRHNWRYAFSWEDEATPIAYRSEQPDVRFALTTETYANPEAIWDYVYNDLAAKPNKVTAGSTTSSSGSGSDSTLGSGSSGVARTTAGGVGGWLVGAGVAAGLGTFLSL